MLARAACAALAVILALPAYAQGWPQRTVKLIVPLGPGAGADIGARLLADRLNKRWGQPVVVENRPGGDAMVAIGAVIGANDDHTLLFGPSSSFVGHPYQHAKLPYNPAEIVPIVRVTNTLVTITAPAALGLSSLSDLVALARKEPGKLNWAAITGLNDLIFQSFVKTSGISMVRVPYRDAVQALNDLSENRIQAYSSAYAIARPQVLAGKVKVIALTNSARAGVLADVATAREAGYPVLEFDGLVGVYGTPVVAAAVRDKIAKDVIEFLADPLIVDRLTATGQVVNPGNAAQFSAAIEKQRDGAATTAKVLGLKAAQ